MRWLDAYLLKKIFFNLYLFLRETECEQGRNRERRHRNQAVSTEPDAGLELTDHEIMHDLSRSWMLNRLSHPGTPDVCLFLRERERDRQSVNRGGAEREGDTESEAGSGLRAVSTEPNVGLELMNCEIMT